MLQAQSGSNHWNTFCFLVVLVAAMHYVFMRVYGVQVHKSTFVYTLTGASPRHCR